MHLFKDTLTFWHVFFGKPQPSFFLDFHAFFSVSVTFVPNLFGPKDALIRLLAVSNRGGHDKRLQRISPRTVWTWAVIEVVSHQWQCHLQFDASMVDEYDSNTAGGIDCQHFECRGGGGGVGRWKLLGCLGRSSKFFEAHFFEAEKETVAGSTDGCYAGSCFLASVMQWDVEDFPPKNCSKMSVKISHLFF